MLNSAIVAPMSSEAYWQKDILDGERKRVFFQSWIFAGFADDLSQDNDYISFTIAGMPIVARNMKGQLVAFRNVCSHRHSLIHPPGKGNAMFRCLFHGWVYDKEGVPVGIPENKKSFGLEKEDRCKIALQQLEIDRCGQFVFVRVTPGGATLKQFLGAMYPRIESLSGIFTKEYGRVDQEWLCNWKTGLEITLEGYHLPLVHPHSFADHIGGIDKSLDEAKTDDPTPDKVNNDSFGHTEYIGPHSLNISDLGVISQEHLNTVAKRLHLPQKGEVKSYEHLLIFPNMMIGINGGTNMCVERYEPLSPDKTRVECWLKTSDPQDPKTSEGLIWQTITKQWVDWTVSILAEDQFACEATQKAIRYAPVRGLLGRVEDRVRHYQSLSLRKRIRNSYSMNVSYNFSDKVVLVTGPSPQSAIGQAIAQRLAQSGAKVILVARGVEGLEATRVTLNDTDKHVVAPFDLNDLDAIPAFLKKLTEQHGALNGIVHCASHQGYHPIRMMNAADFEKVFRLNVGASLMLARGLRQKNVAAKPSSLIFIGSTAGLRGIKGRSLYAGSKATQIAITKTLGIELAADHIRVNCIAPCVVRGYLADRMFERLSPEQNELLASQHPMGYAEGGDVASSTMFLLSDEARMITGSVLPVDGGYSAQ